MNERWRQLRPRVIIAVIAGARTAAACIAALLIAQRVGLRFPIYALIAAVVVTESSTRITASSGWQRLLGTLLGTGAGIVGALYFPGSVIAVGVSAFLIVSVCMLGGFEKGAKIAAYIPAVIIISYSASPAFYGGERFLEVGIGISCAIAASAIFEGATRLLTAQRDPVKNATGTH